MPTKQCSKCKEIKELSKFYPRKDSKDGFRSECISCQKQRSTNYYQKNREKILVETLVYRSEHKKEKEIYNSAYYSKHKEEVRIQQADYRKNLSEQDRENQAISRALYNKENKEQIANKKSIHYQENKEQILAKNSIYRDKNEEKILIISAKYYQENREQIKKKNAAYARANPGKTISYAIKRKLSKLQRTPKGLTKDQLKEITAFYVEAARLTKETGIPHHVDHILPLRGKDISGLHVPWNLQVLTAEENNKKGNSFDLTYRNASWRK